MTLSLVFEKSSLFRGCHILFFVLFRGTSVCMWLDLFVWSDYPDKEKSSGLSHYSPPWNYSPHYCIITMLGRGGGGYRLLFLGKFTCTFFRVYVTTKLGREGLWWERPKFWMGSGFHFCSHLIQSIVCNVFSVLYYSCDCSINSGPIKIENRKKEWSGFKDECENYVC